MNHHLREAIRCAIQKQAMEIADKECNLPFWRRKGFWTNVREFDIDRITNAAQHTLDTGELLEGEY